MLQAGVYTEENNECHVAEAVFFQTAAHGINVSMFRSDAGIGRKLCCKAQNRRSIPPVLLHGLKDKKYLEAAVSAACAGELRMPVQSDRSFRLFSCRRH